jgi:peptide/nickel transport system substrate-binding protein
MVRKLKAAVWLGVVGAAAVALLVASGAGASTEQTYPRSETLYTSGKQWGPPSTWNPMDRGGYAMGTIGFVYEPLFLYDPLTDQFKPWLAKSGSWTSANVYQVNLRPGITWADGRPFTADDVVFTTELGKMPTVPYAPIWNFLENVTKVNNLTVRFNFSAAQYQQFANFLYGNPMLPKHIWQGKSEEQVVTAANRPPIGTGPYRYQTHSQDRMVWVKRDGWWAKKALGLDVKPKYIVDIVNGSNNVALGLVLQGGLDLSNNFLPGIATLVRGGYGVQTYYKQAPYMLSANTAWLVPNNAKAPTNDPKFRRALAFSVDVSRIVEGVYGNIVRPADPSGLLPNWAKYVNQGLNRQLGFSYNPKKAKQMLAAAGYRDRNGDGFVEGKDGKSINLSLIVPNGWTDWMESIRVIADSAKQAGIRITPKFPDFNALVAARNAGKFDLLINNEVQISNTPWQYYEYMYRLPILESQTTRNFQRYNNPRAWSLTQQLDKTPVTNVAGMKSIISQLQRIQLTDMPVIPLWYNGAWAQYNNSVWTNWPSSEKGANHFLPVTWNGYWNMTGILMLTQLKPAPKG